MDDSRITILEQRTATLGDSMGRVETKVDSIAETLNSLVRIEERQIAINNRLTSGAITMQDHEARLKVIEVVIPGLVEKSKWVVLGILGIITLVGSQILHLVMK